MLAIFANMPRSRWSSSSCSAAIFSRRSSRVRSFGSSDGSVPSSVTGSPIEGRRFDNTWGLRQFPDPNSRPSALGVRYAPVCCAVTCLAFAVLLFAAPARADTSPAASIVFIEQPTTAQCFAGGSPGFFWDQKADGSTYGDRLPATIGPYPVGSTLHWWLCRGGQASKAAPVMEGQDSYGSFYSERRPADPNTQYGEPPCDSHGSSCLGFSHTYLTAGTFEFHIVDTGYQAQVVIGDPAPPPTTSPPTTTPAPTTTAPPPATTTTTTAAASPPTTVPTSSTTVPPDPTTTLAEPTSSIPDESTTSAPTGQVAIRETGGGDGGMGVPVAAGVGVVSLAGFGALWWRRRGLATP
jgi:hypothetical protein